MRKIKLTQGKYAVVDAADYEWLNQWSWQFHRGYAVRWAYLGGGRKNPKRQWAGMHRLINNTPSGLDTDHINRDKLDNRKCNLRAVTRSQNLMNVGLQKNNPSGFRGVTFHKRINKWRARISAYGVQVDLGYFETAQEASQYYMAASSKLHDYNSVS